MRKILCGFILLGLLSAAPLAYAQTTKIGHFDLYRVMNDSKRWAKERDAFVNRGNASGYPPRRRAGWG